MTNWIADLGGIPWIDNFAMTYRFRPIRCGRGAYRPGEEIGPVEWPFHDLILLRRGAVRFEAGSGVLEGARDSALLCPPGARIRGVAGPDGCSIWVQHFRAAPGPASPPALPDRPVLRHAPAFDSWIAALVRRLDSLQSGGPPGDAAEFSPALALLLLALERASGGGPPPGASAPRALAKIRARIAEGPFPLPTVEALAAEAGWSASNLRQSFRRHYGEGIGACLSAARLAEAMRLLRETTAPLKEIALRTGYSEAASFHRAFVRVNGETPGSFRRRTRGIF